MELTIMSKLIFLEVKQILKKTGIDNQLVVNVNQNLK